VRDAPEIIAAYLGAAKARSSESSYANQARFYFGLTSEPTAAEIAAIAHYYPFSASTT
jgi:hypothetical protein